MGRARHLKALRRTARVIGIGLPDRKLIGGTHELKTVERKDPVTGVVTSGFMFRPSQGINARDSVRGIYRQMKKDGWRA